MPIKKDTKEKFTVYTPDSTTFSANMAEELMAMIREGMASEPPHVIVNLKHLEQAEEASAQRLISLQQESYEKNISFVLCGIHKSLEPLFQQSINRVPSESEAWDMVQMEEIERELLDQHDDPLL
jgi:anti-anti-sigma regulatory factor